MDTSITINEVSISCNADLMPKVQETITTLFLASTRNRKEKVVFLRCFICEVAEMNNFDTVDMTGFWVMLQVLCIFQVSSQPVC